jgi:hypothetical protein
MATAKFAKNVGKPFTFRDILYSMLKIFLYFGRRLNHYEAADEKGA